MRSGGCLNRCLRLRLCPSLGLGLSQSGLPLLLLLLHLLHLLHLLLSLLCLNCSLLLFLLFLLLLFNLCLRLRLRLRLAHDIHLVGKTSLWRCKTREMKEETKEEIREEMREEMREDIYGTSTRVNNISKLGGHDTAVTPSAKL